MQSLEINFKLHPGQSEVHKSKARFKTVSCGRRWGKTHLAWIELLQAALSVKGLYWWVAPIYKELLAVTQTIYATTPLNIFTKKTEIGNVIRYLRLVNGSEIYFHSADTEDSLRGVALHGLVLDEAPQIKRSRWEAELLPTLIDKNGWAVLIGTPKGLNWYYESYVKGQDRLANPDWQSWSMSSYTNTKEKGGYLDKTSIDLIANQMPELTRKQEIYAQFLEGEGLVFRNVDSSVMGSICDPPSSVALSMGCDLAKTQDFTVLTALGSDGHIYGFDRFQQLDWGFQKLRIKSFIQRFHGILTMDSTGLGDPIYDDLRREGLNIRGYKFTSESKRQLIENLSIMMDQRKITIPEECKVLINELKSYAYDIGPTGNISYGAPEGLFDDCVISLGLAAWNMQRGKPSAVKVVGYQR